MMNIGVITTNGTKLSARRALGRKDDDETRFLTLNLLRLGTVAETDLTHIVTHRHLRGMDLHGNIRINHGQHPLVLGRILIV